jgi:hypothetical protein
MDRVIKNAKSYLGNDVVISKSTRKNKKFMILKPDGTNVHFGDTRYKDFTQHKDKERQENYLARTSEIKGDWRKDKYSANNLSRSILWR